MDVKEFVARIPGSKAEIMTRASLHPVLRKRIEASALRVFSGICRPTAHRYHRGDRAHPQRNDGRDARCLRGDWRERWLVERGVEIISEASRHLTDDLKARHPEIPWSKVAAIGHVLRHACERVASDVRCTMICHR